MQRELTKIRKRQEQRRLEAIPLFQSGVRQAEVARRLKVSRTAVGRWFHAWLDGSDLKGRKAPGRPLRMEDDAVQAAMRLIEHRPEITARELRQWIWDAFQIDYHHDHIHRLRDNLKRRIQKEINHEPVVGD